MQQCWWQTCCTNTIRSSPQCKRIVNVGPVLKVCYNPLALRTLRRRCEGPFCVIHLFNGLELCHITSFVNTKSAVPVTVEMICCLLVILLNTILHTLENHSQIDTALSRSYPETKMCAVRVNLKWSQFISNNPSLFWNSIGVSGNKLGLFGNKLGLPKRQAI